MAQLPTGTLTYLFTDVEGSTRLWEDHPDRMGHAHARHLQIIAASVEGQGGTLVRPRGEGDSTFSVFTDPAAAVAAACDLQIALHRESWPEQTPIRVRVALHTGPSELLWGDYNSADVNRCARLRSLAHGGQALVSQQTVDLASARLPAGIQFHSLGTHRLKDLHRPEHVHQILHPDLPAEFPPLRSLEVLPTNLPEQLTSFIGRERELAEVRTLLGKTRLLTLTGSGGAGKTRLALQAGAEMLDEFADGVWLLELAPVTDGARIVQTVSAALGVREEPGRPLEAKLLEHLHQRELLLILDNCEHLIEPVARFADAALKSAPLLKILATSREALGILGETSWRVPSLDIPDVSEGVALEAWQQSAALQLFVERARAARPGFSLTQQNAPSLIQVCRRLDGIPLAIELAAARANLLSVEQIAARLDDRFRLLTGGSRTALPRQQTLRALIDWSYDLLTEPERLLLRRLSVFPVSWTLEAAEAICADLEESMKSEVSLPAMEVLELLSGLVDKSLVLPLEQEDREPRYRMLETVRQYARERLMDSGELLQLRERHQEWCVWFAESARVGMNGPNLAEWFNRIDAERDNLRSAIGWTPEKGSDAPIKIAGALVDFWGARGRLTEDRECIFQALKVAVHAERTATLARAWLAAGFLCAQMGDLVTPWDCYVEALAIFREIGHKGGISDALNLQGLLRWKREERAEAEALFEESLALRREIGSKKGIAAGLNNLAILANERGDNATAYSLHKEILALRREIGDQVGIASSLNNLGVACRDQEDLAGAQEYMLQAHEAYRTAGYESGVLLALYNLGLIALLGGHIEEAKRYFLDSLALSQAFGRIFVILQLRGLAALYTIQGDADRSARLYGAIEGLTLPTDHPPHPYEQRIYAQWREQARSVLGDETYQKRVQEGASLTLEGAIRTATESEPSPLSVTPTF